MTNRDPALGDKVKHKVTGFTGIITSHSKHLAGCDRFWIEPSVDAAGKAMDGQWADIDLIEIIEANVLMPITYARKAPGGFDLPNSR